MKIITVAKYLALTGIFMSSYSHALQVPMGLVGQVGVIKPIGTIDVIQTQYGLVFKPNLKDLPAGIHGMHIHESPLCDNYGHAAMGHFDPKKTGKHMGPYNDDGHLGDLPALSVNSDGTAMLQVLAPRLKLSDLEGHSIIIHAGGDNYSDKPANGGGGDRIACGIIPIIPPDEKKLSESILSKGHHEAAIPSNSISFNWDDGV